MGKVCSRCKIEKDESEFYSNSRIKDGIDYYCKECRKTSSTNSLKTRNISTSEYLLNRWKENMKFVDSLKTECCKCGENRPWVIQFHHINPEAKSFVVAACGTRSYETISKEISKCVCLCSNCHNEFHYFFGNNPDNPEKALEDFMNDNY